MGIDINQLAREAYKHNPNMSESEFDAFVQTKKKRDDSQYNETKKLAKMFGYATTQAEYNKGMPWPDEQAMKKIYSLGQYNNERVMNGKSALRFISADYDPVQYSDQDNEILSDYLNEYKGDFNPNIYSGYYNRKRYHDDYDLSTAEDKAAYEAGDIPLKHKVTEKIKSEAADLAQKIKSAQQQGQDVTADYVRQLMAQEPTMAELDTVAKHNAKLAQEKALAGEQDTPDFSATQGTKLDTAKPKYDLEALKKYGYDQQKGFDALVEAYGADKIVANIQNYANAGDTTGVQELIGRYGDTLRNAGYDTEKLKQEAVAARPGNTIQDFMSTSHETADIQKAQDAYLGTIGAKTYDFNNMPALGANEVYIGNGIVVNKNEVLSDPEKTQKFLDLYKKLESASTPTSTKKSDQFLKDLAKNLGAKDETTGQYLYFDTVTPKAGENGVQGLPTQVYKYTTDKALADRKNAELILTRSLNLSPKDDKDAGGATAVLGGLANSGLFYLPEVFAKTDSGSSMFTTLQKQHPFLYGAGELAGMMIPMEGIGAGIGGLLKLAPKLEKAAPILYRVIKGGATFGAYTGISDIVQGKPADEIAVDVINNAIIGGAGEAGFKMLGDLAKNYLPKANTARFNQWVSSGRMLNKLDEQTKELLVQAMKGELQKVSSTLQGAGAENTTGVKPQNKSIVDMAEANKAATGNLPELAQGKTSGGTIDWHEVAQTQSGTVMRSTDGNFAISEKVNDPMSAEAGNKVSLYKRVEADGVQRMEWVRDFKSAEQARVAAADMLDRGELPRYEYNAEGAPQVADSRITGEGMQPLRTTEFAGTQWKNITRDGDAAETWISKDGKYRVTDSGTAFTLEKQDPAGKRFEAIGHFADETTLEDALKQERATVTGGAVHQTRMPSLVELAQGKTAASTGADLSAATSPVGYGGEDFAQLLDDIRNENQDLKLSAFVNKNGDIVISKIELPTNLQNQGIGTDVMQRITKYADEHGQRMALTPSTQYGGTSVPRLRNFYKRFGFVENKGANLDQALYESMYRTPKAAERAGNGYGRVTLGAPEARIGNLVDLAQGRGGLPETPAARKAFTTVDRAEAQQQKVFEQQAKAESTPGGQSVQRTQEVKNLYVSQKSLRADLERIKQEYRITPMDIEQINSVSKGAFDWSQVAPQTEAMAGEPVDNAIKIRQMKEYQAVSQKLDAVESEIKQYRKGIYETKLNKAENLLKGSDTWNDKKTPIQYAREIQERNIEDIAPMHEAEKIKKEVLQPIHEHVADMNRANNAVREQVKAHKLSRRESELLQRYGEGKIRLDEIPNKEIAGKIQTALQQFRSIYDEYFDKINDALVRNGYEPVEKRANYFPHFNEPDAMIDKIKKAFGVDISNTEIPSDIIGQTEYFRPGKNYFGNLLRRTGYDTTYDAVAGLDKYVVGANRVIYLTDDIQQLRAMGAVLRYRASEEGIEKAIKDITTSGMDAETMNDSLDSLYKKIDIANKMGEDSAARMTPEQIKARRFRLPNYIINLDEYTNLLAGKKSALDRSLIDHALGRPVYKLFNWLQRRTGMNMVSANMGSALTNFIPMTQGLATEGFGNTLAAMRDTVKSLVADDGFKYKSSFLSSRFPEKPLVMTGTEKAADILGTPFQLADKFTSNVITRARYMGGLEKGMSAAEAMRYADDWAARSIGDRSVGAKPTLFDSKTLGLVTQFQLEVNNQLSFLLKDLPRDIRGTGAAHISSTIIKLILYSYMYDKTMEALTGRKNVNFDPIGLATGFYEDATGTRLPIHPEDIFKAPEKSQQGDATKALSNLSGGIINNTPFASGVATLAGYEDVGRLPISAGIPNIPNMFPNGKYSQTMALKELSKPMVYWAAPFGGGQAQKSVQSLVDLARGGEYATNSQGEQYMKFPVDNKNVLTDAQAVLFGKYSTPQGRAYIDNGMKPLTAEQTQKYDELRGEGVPTDPLWKSFQILAGLKPENGRKSVTDQQMEDAIHGVKGLTDGQQQSIIDLVVYDQKKSEETQARYDQMAAAGIAQEKLDRLYIDLNKLTPRPNHKTVTEVDRRDLILDCTYLTDKEKHTAIVALGLTVKGN